MNRKRLINLITGFICIVSLLNFNLTTLASVSTLKNRSVSLVGTDITQIAQDFDGGSFDDGGSLDNGGSFGADSFDSSDSTENMKNFDLTPDNSFSGDSTDLGPAPQDYDINPQDIDDEANKFIQEGKQDEGNLLNPDPNAKYTDIEADKIDKEADKLLDETTNDLDNTKNMNAEDKKLEEDADKLINETDKALDKDTKINDIKDINDIKYYDIDNKFIENNNYINSIGSYGSLFTRDYIYGVLPLVAFGTSLVFDVITPAILASRFGPTVKVVNTVPVTPPLAKKYGPQAKVVVVEYHDSYKPDVKIVEMKDDSGNLRGYQALSKEGDKYKVLKRYSTKAKIHKTYDANKQLTSLEVVDSAFLIDKW